MTALSALVVLAGLLAGTVLVIRQPALQAPSSATAAGRRDDVVVVIPARDEEDVLPALLADLAGQTLWPSRVVVVDDGSQDATVAVASRQRGVQLLPGEATPPGWNPKSWAVHQGVRQGDEDVIILLDADVRLAPQALASVVAALEQRPGLVSVAPRHDVGRLVEAVSLPFNLVALMGAGAGWTPRQPDAHAAFGPCLAISRSSYDAIGGHAADRGDLLDDVALARRAEGHGLAVSLYRGAGLVRYRMYRQGVMSIIDGWSKNIAAGAIRTPAAAGAGVGLWVTAVLVPLVALASAGDGAELAAAAAAWATVGGHTVVLARLVGRFPAAAGLLAPLLALTFVVIAARSALTLVLRRPVRWKGRDLVQARGEATGA